MAGESLEVADVGALGIPGDRRVQVYNADELVVTARTHSRLLGHRGTQGLGWGLLFEEPAYPARSRTALGRPRNRTQEKGALMLGLTPVLET